MKRIVIIFLAIFLITNIKASNNNLQQLIAQANKFYSQKQYDSALTLYLQVLNKGWQAPELYYNIGNVYFRKGNLAKAIVFYERAYRLAPSNEKIKHNLIFARQFVQDKFENVPEFFLIKWWRSMSLWFSANIWAVISIAFFVMALILFYIFLFSNRLTFRRLSFYFGVILILFSLLSFSLSISNRQYFENSNEAIIMHTTSVRSAPTTEGTELYILHEGVKVKILSANDGWIEVKLPNGSIGWLKKTDVEPI